MAKADYFLKLDGIEGESQDQEHKKEIEIASFSFGASNTGTMAYGGGGGAGKVSIHDMQFTMRHNKASPNLFLACANGKHIPKGIVTVRKQGEKQQEYLKIELEDCLVTSYQVGGHDSGGGDSTPMDSFSLNFAKIKMDYKEQKPDGSLGPAVAAGWDVKANVKYG